MPGRFYLCTAIDYTNGAPHIGHAYEKVLADVIGRYHRLNGEEVFFLTGVDQHGQKVQQSADRAGVPPQEFVDSVTAKFVTLWEKLDVEYDGWAATTAERHKECVRGILQRLWNEGKIYKDTQAGYYSVRQEQFLTDKERNAEGEFGPEWGEVEHREEENYYFRLAENKEWLLQMLQRRTDLIVPEFRQTELRNAIEKLSGDLCISRPKSRLQWGIELPFDSTFVTYVWFDALVNYISFAPGGGYDASDGAPQKEFDLWWPPAIFIGKDILVPAHGIYWMAMLHALGFDEGGMPRLIVHGWWNISGAKMSKSLGNAIDPDLLADKYGSEALRYYLVADIATGKDADFSEQRLVERYNADLANNIGNLLNRSLSMSHRYRDGVLRRLGGDGPLRGQAADTLNAVREQLDAFQPQAALAAVGEFVTACNTYVEMTAPWKLAKDPERVEMLDHVLYGLAESLRIIALLVSPFLPRASAGILEQLNSPRAESFEAAQWGGLPDGHRVGKPVPLFPRIDIAAET
ncbi:methionine--tRNA ligase [soil metagenome]